MLLYFASQATNENDRLQLEKLAKVLFYKIEYGKLLR
jgi:hypothetical protein